MPPRNAKHVPRRIDARPARARAGRPPGCVVDITADEERHLAEDVAYFRAERYRNVQPGSYRKADLRQAESEITAVVKKRRRG